MTTLKSKYEELETERSPYLTRARDAAKLTIPSLFPTLGSSGATTYDTPYQSLGARGVKNVANKLLVTLMPPNASFFKMTISSAELQKASINAESKAKVDEAFAGYEREVTQNIEASSVRPIIFEGFKQFLIAGNVLFYLPDTEGIKYYRMDRYVAQRDPMGELYRLIIKDSVAKDSLPKAVQGIVSESQADSKSAKLTTVDVYTNVELDRQLGRWLVMQEINGVKVPGSDGWYPKESSPWIALRFAAASDEDYGRGFTEEVIGDLISFEELTKAIVQGSTEAARVVRMVNPNGMTSATAVESAESGDVISGRKEDVTSLQLDKSVDLRVAAETARKIEDNLSYAFMLNSAIQRPGERVTAEEIRFMAGELETAQGGLYSLLSREFQLPLVKRIIARMEDKGELPALPEGTAKPAITTGLEALGRGYDLNKLDLFISKLIPFGPEVIKEYVNISDLISRVGAATNVDTKGLIKSEQEVEQRRQQDAMMQAAQSAVPHVANNLTPNIQAQ